MGLGGWGDCNRLLLLLLLLLLRRRRRRRRLEGKRRKWQ